MRILLLVAAATVALTGAALAQTPPAGPQGGRGGAAGGGGGGAGAPGLTPAQRMTMLDANTDGFIDKTEWHGPPGRFDAMDTNKDGKVSLAEITAAPARQGPGGPPAAP